MNFKAVRQLAKSNKYQLLYNRAKELSLKLFNNNTDLTKVQIWFIYWLGIYKSLYLDLAQKEKFISDEVINDDIRTEAYLLWRDKINTNVGKTAKKKTKINTSSDIPTVIFRKKVK